MTDTIPTAHEIPALTLCALNDLIELLQEGRTCLQAGDTLQAIGVLSGMDQSIGDVQACYRLLLMTRESR